MEPEIDFEALAVLWDDGDRRLRAADPAQRRRLEVVIDAVVAELRRRLGAPFSAAALGALYLEGNDWCFDLATRLMPEHPEAWDMPTIIGAAFSRYVRRAYDYGGGRRRLPEESEGS
ncbi:hypothetical protein [Conexibacter sp. DBS9H8]|uniref:hypothetical protein n=1 Tax=Conexibacter sp. DBS9H8 TaxID=2937801 RepID=UPI002010855C|nr:hypothetical protein [Conexibacter sp. DBS9H8]